MVLWKNSMTVDEINQLIQGTMDEWLGINYVELGDRFVKAEMVVDHRTVQPFGILHGGASCALSESVGSIAGNMCVDQTKNCCVGQSIHTNHIRKAIPGERLTATALPIHIGKTSHLWEIRVENNRGELIALTRLQLAILERMS